MVPMMTVKDMLFIHFLIGIVFTVILAIRANRSGSIRNIFDFGNGIFGEQKKWIQWYSWSLVFEVITSFLYMHTQLLYYELGMSLFEAGALVVGAFITDRLVDFFTGNVDLEIPKPYLSVVTDRVQEYAKTMATSLKEQANTAITPKVSADTRQQEKDDFDKIIKGH